MINSMKLEKTKTDAFILEQQLHRYTNTAYTAVVVRQIWR